LSQAVIASRERPNILMIMSDQHNKHFLGCYGSRIARTSNLDRLAEEGVRFTNAYCPAPLCVPSRMSFMTGRTPTRNRVWNNNHVLSSGIPTWAHVLGLAGYETILFGRMHFNGPDQHHGFEHRPFGSLHSKHPGVPLSGGPMWTKFSPDTCGQLRVAVETAGTGRTFYQWLDDETTRRACDWLRTRGDAGRPFAAVVGYTLPHCPFIAPEDLFEHYFDRVDLPELERDQPPATLRFRRTRGILEPFSDHQVRVARAAYYALCEYVDRRAGEVLAALSEAGLTDRTLVVYTSDHGEMAGEHGCWWKSHYYEGSVGVPLIVRGPGVPRRSVAEPGVCNLIDLGPTFAEVAGGRFDPPVDGRSLWPILTGRAPADWPNETFSELVDFRTGRFASRMIRRGPWKLWTFDAGTGEQPDLALFNLEEDPGEVRERANDPAADPARRDLLARLYHHWNPAAAIQESDDLDASFETLCRHGRMFPRQHECAPVLPPADYETFVQR
jgi:choline-sulfatase